ncbi:hypothetical protein LMJ53_14445 [Rheinheimera sp. UJ51]|uniref:hypothetical protein n=1 Tax=Rheinheimera sp. UJ51 TaxID=2892446 RepID=UPI001E415698|nr:hypothetical protein [Rheinheimera sp. UJ51]MCC5452924.1 hypothetical protein [Rheinheimera sp. UJ51]
MIFIFYGLLWWILIYNVKHSYWAVLAEFSYNVFDFVGLYQFARTLDGFFLSLSNGGDFFGLAFTLGVITVFFLDKDFVDEMNAAANKHI